MKITNFANFTKAVIKHAMGGFVEVAPEIAAERMEICRACVNFNPEKTECLICGCKLDIKTKWPNENCPINKWTSLSGETSNVQGAENYVGQVPYDCGCGKN